MMEILAMAQASSPPIAPYSKADVEITEEYMLSQPQVELPLIHRFAPGCYLREIFMPAGTIVLGHEHTTEHFNIILQGRALVSINGKIKEVVAPDTFVSGAGDRKILLIAEDMIWQTVHPMDLGQLPDEMTPEEIEMLGEELEPQLITKSQAFLRHDEIKTLREYRS